MIYVLIIRIRFIFDIYFIWQAMVMKSIQNANMAFIDVRMVRVKPPYLTVNTLLRMSLCDERIHKLLLFGFFLHTNMKNYPNTLDIFSCMLNTLSFQWNDYFWNSFKPLTIIYEYLTMKCFPLWFINVWFLNTQFIFSVNKYVSDKKQHKTHFS